MADQWAMYYPLQDANYNVIAYEGGGLICQYDAYGRMRIRDPYASNGTWIDHEYNPLAPTSFDALPGIQGRTQDRENGSICFGARCLDPDLGRWLQTDPNGTGLVVSNSMRYHGQAPSVSATVDTFGQYEDGMSLQEGFRSNPVNGRDPTGLSLLDDNWNRTLADWGRYAQTYSGRAWQRRFDSVADADTIFGDPNSAFDEDVLAAIQESQDNRLDALAALEEASHKLRYGHRLARAYAGAAQEWDDFVWEQNENALFDMLLGPFGSTICFEGDTQVLMADRSFKPIAEVSVGESVLSVAGAMRGLRSALVESTHASTVASLVEVHIGSILVRCTPEHPLFVLNVGWLAAELLSPGNFLLAADGLHYRVTDVTFIDKPTEVYNIDIAGYHVYFATPLKLVSHNTCKDYYKRAGRFLRRLELNKVIRIHHLITQDAAKKFSSFFKRVGFHLNHIDNLKFVREVGHRGFPDPHRAYNAYVFNEVSGIEKAFAKGQIDQIEAFNRLLRLQATLRKELRPGGRWHNITSGE